MEIRMEIIIAAVQGLDQQRELRTHNKLMVVTLRTPAYRSKAQLNRSKDSWIPFISATWVKEVRLESKVDATI